MVNKPDSRVWRGYLAAVFFLGLSGVGLYHMRLGPVAMAVGKPMEEVFASLKFPNGQPLRDHYTGIAPLDFGLRFLVAAFLPGAGGFDKNFQVQQIYFLVSFFAIISIWSADAGRKRSAWALTSWTTFWALLYQTVGGAVIIPLYYLAYLSESTKKDYWSLASRQVPISYAKALLPSLLLGYLLPTIAMYLPYPDSDLNITQALVAFWQPTPLYVNILIFLISTWLERSSKSSKAASTSPTEYVQYLEFLYMTCFVVSAITHIYIVRWCFLSPKLSLSYALLHIPTTDIISMTEMLHFIFQVDCLVISVAGLAASFITIWDLKRIGKTDQSLIKVGVAIILGAVTVGPAATVAGAWYMRERIMSEGEEKKSAEKKE